MNTLEPNYINFVGKIQDFESGFHFSKNNISLKDVKLRSDQLIICRGRHPYGESVLLDMLLFFAEREVYQCLGLCLISFLFSGRQDYLEISLNNTNSEIKLLKIVNPIRNSHDFHELSFSIDSYQYHPQKILKNIFGGEKDDRFLPKIILTDSMGRGIPEGEDHRDIAVMHCNLGGFVNFINLLIDFGQPSNDVCELALETYAGSKSVANTSAEMIFNLPGSDWWNFEERPLGSE